MHRNGAPRRRGADHRATHKRSSQRVTVASGRCARASGARLRRESDGVAKGLDHAALVGLARAGDVECGAVVDGGAHEWKADGDIYPGLEAEDLYRTVALVVVHGDHEVEVAPAGAEKQRVGRERAFDLDTARAGGFDAGDDFLLLLAAAEKTAFSGVRIDAADGDARALHAGADQRIVS